MTNDILIVDDEADIRELVSGILNDEGFGTRVAPDSDAAMAEISARRPSLVILDIWLQGSRLDGLEILRAIRADHPNLPVVMISGHGNIETAVAAIKQGAHDFIEKPFKADHLIHVVTRAIETARLRLENQELRERVVMDEELTGKSHSIQSVRQTIARVAQTGSRVLVSGPAGSGKEVVARLIHRSSRRARGPFVVINAANMAPERMEAELFGIEANGETPSRVGVFERAHGGTLLIDEVSDMPTETQAKILRALVDQTFVRVGGTRPVEVDVRVISATSRDLRSEIEAGRFREDLYHRLNVVPIAIPPLTARRDDIPELIEFFMRKLSISTGLTERTISEDAMLALQSFDWPGNVRQLRNMVERLLILPNEDEARQITAARLPPEIGGGTGNGSGDSGVEIMLTASLRDARMAFERQYLLAQVNRFGGNISKTAEFVGMERSALHRKLKSLGVSSPNRGP
jgi:two-component system, NtrC family, nitrogen regulation response regulator NtrX